MSSPYRTSAKPESQRGKRWGVDWWTKFWIRRWQHVCVVCGRKSARTSWRGGGDMIDHTATHGAGHYCLDFDHGAHDLFARMREMSGHPPRDEDPKSRCYRRRQRLAEERAAERAEQTALDLGSIPAWAEDR